MNETPVPHPLDADDEDEQTSRGSYRPAVPTIAYQPILKPSLIVAAVATVVLFMSSVFTIITPLGSGANVVATFLFRFSGVVLILALAAVLIAFRIGYLRAGAYRPNWQLVRGLQGSVGFVSANLIFLAALWLGTLFVSPILGTAAIVISVPLVMIVTGLMITMIVWHDNYLRAFAIGSLTVLAIQLLPMTFFQSMLLANGGPFRGGMANWGPYNVFAISSAALLSLAQLSGLVSAGYVWLIENRARENPADYSLNRPVPEIQARD